MQLTGKELLLTHFTATGYIRLEDLIDYLADIIGGGGSGDPTVTGLNFTMDTSVNQPTGTFRVLTQVDGKNPERVQYCALNTNKIITHGDGRMESVGIADGEAEDFSILVVADGFSRLIYCRYTNTGGVYSLEWSDEIPLSDAV